MSPLICCHLDTVSPVKPLPPDIITAKDTLSLDPRSKALCLGADDRAGVWIALQLLDYYNVGCFHGEEKGCLGSTAYAKTRPRHCCYIGVDRRGSDELATYGYDNPTLLDLFSQYQQTRGSFTDCSALAGITDKPCLNLSVGYQNEHTRQEILDLDAMYQTLHTLQSVYIPTKNYPILDSLLDPIVCDLCSRHAPLYWSSDGLMVCEWCQ
jgi:hypothetical protein